MGQGVKRTQRDYSLTFKLALVEQIEKGELTYKQAQVRYGIQGRSTVLVWLRKHGRQDWSQGASVRAGRSITMPDPDNQTPEQRIKELEQQLALMSQKAQFFEAVVDVLKNDYGVSIGKKATRQVLSQRQVERLTIVRACLFLGISRQTYYKRNRVADERHAQGLQVVRFVRQVRLRQPRVGTRKLHYLLQGQDDDGLKVGRDRLFQILAEHRLLVLPKRAYHKTTHSFHRFYRHPNLLKAGPEQVTPVAPEQVWVADITYLPAKSGPLYLSLVTDAYSRKIVGHHVHEGMHAESVAMAFKKALKQRCGSGELIHHSDRGVQYCSGLYQSLHERYGVKCSMTDGYDCYQNALAERVNGILKGELLLQSPQDLAQAREMVREAVDIYNAERPHHALKYRTPDAVHRGF
ncbi:IS3 family transposase [Aeromonas caviae]|uniref:IS3 family transposase n=1 Tax=Aeromonas TaxID=642 RepID=UPI000CDE1C48|nr:MULTISPECIES: IS3 family transposase [Aeromonas]MCR3893077.1 IS3 family transposase [Aeromonas caviae]POV86809.1 IS3 family transposase [Aeromonas sp. ASNIH8]WGY73670.1 IS3 family transposase [Aeromonas caviae]WGY74301.1 IS3 family transposase [Aeromonas caviae]WGY75351.1 IS3 family transposase [Aeromonas caviae]